MNFLNNFVKSWQLILNNKNKIFLILMFDLLFLFTLFLFSNIFLGQIINNFDLLQEKGSLIDSENFSEENINYFTQQLQGLQDILFNIFLIVFLLVLIIFLLWCVFQGINWFITGDIVNKTKFSFKNFLKLNIINVFWFLIVVIFFFLFSKGLGIDLSYEEKTGAGLMIVGFLSLVYYFLSINYSLFLLRLKIFKSIKDSFIFGVKKFYILIPVFLLIFINFLLVALIFYYLRNLSWIFGLVGLIAFLLLIAWSRIFILLNLKEIY